MKYTLAFITASSLLIGTPAAILAQDGVSPGASGFAPGQKERAAGDKGASASAPGQLQKQPGGQPGDAQQYAPGQQMKASATTAKGSATKPDSTAGKASAIKPDSTSKVTKIKPTRGKATGSAPVKGANNPLIE